MHRDGGACFCTRGATHGYDVDLLILALSKTVTPGGGPLTVPSGAGRTADHLTFLFNRKILAAQKPMTYTDLLSAGPLLLINSML